VTQLATQHVGDQFARRHATRGFTLVELLVVIVIIGILTAMVGVVAVGAGQASRESNTRATITKVDRLVNQHHQTYRSRRAPLSPVAENVIRINTNPTTRGLAMAEARLYALRELMVMEMPDRWSDVMLKAITDPPRNVTPGAPAYLSPSTGSTYGGPTPLVEAYRRQYYAIANATNSITGDPNTADRITDNQGAECLYMIVMLATANGEARGLFGEAQTGDVDGDGAPEFIDGWGRPINFLRWAPGFESDLQLNANELETLGIDRWIASADGHHDPLDMYRADPLAFALTPLVFSAGPDGEYGIRTVKPAVTWATPVNIIPGSGSTIGSTGRKQFFNPRLTPYVKRSGDEDGIDAYLGTLRDESGIDNLHNHQTATQ
jgi:prepilin-type N-terminal cleavage/methylation domain-containing protein